MGEMNLMHGWMVLLGLFATIALILTALGILLGIVKPADALKHLGTILDLVIALILIPSVLMSAWSDMSLWQQIALIAIGIGVRRWRQPRRQTQKKEKG